MRSLIFITVLEAIATVALAVPTDQSPPSHHHGSKPMVHSSELQESIQISALMAKAQQLQDFAYATPERNRLAGSPGHNATVNYLYDTFTALSDYYTVAIQTFSVPMGNATLIINGTNYAIQAMDFTNPGHPAAPLVVVANVGCNASDYPATLSGQIALLSRGSCTFASKSLLAKAAGAIGVLIYNNQEGVLAGTLAQAGDYPPTGGISKADGLALVAAITGGSSYTADLEILTFTVPSYNVIAQTKMGDQDNVLQLGGHTDSVKAGPGINDDGSGTLGIVEVALQLVKFSVKNSIRFSWWSGEEEGLIGSTYYVKQLSQAERDKIRLYLNFDMIASPNFVYGIYDGDGSAFNTSGPPGSAEAEKLFEDYFKKKNLPSVPSPFNGRSDYGPFLDAGIACGGLETGAEQLKTAEEQVLFGGQAGIAYDINYHGAGDQVSNLNQTAWLVNTKGIAHAVATYATSFASIPPKNITTNSTLPRMKRGVTAAEKKYVGPKALY